MEIARPDFVSVGSCVCKQSVLMKSQSSSRVQHSCYLFERAFVYGMNRVDALFRQVQEEGVVIKRKVNKSAQQRSCHFVTSL